MITITRGQWFPLTIGNIRYGGAAFDLQGATEVSASLVSTLGARSPLKFEITAYNELSAVSDGSLSAGKYSIEVSCKGADGKSYRMKSPEAVIEVSSSTTPSIGSTSVRVSGDEWELTADVEMHEAQARTYMSLLEEARKGAVKATEDATEAAGAVNAAKAACEEQTAKAEKTNSDITAAEAARVTAENGREAAESERVTVESARVTAENERAQSEQSRESAEAERASAERARADAETARKSAETQRAEAETQRETDFASTKTACETATSNATAATDKANTATASATSAANAATEATDKANAAAVKATSAANAAVEAEQERVEAEHGRVEAEQGRVTAETAREQGFTEKSAHLEELLQYIKGNDIEAQVKLAEAIVNTVNGTGEFVYLDANDGKVKSMPNTNQLGANVAAVYYAGTRSLLPSDNYQMLSAQNRLILSLDLSGWDFEAATDMSRFLYKASALKTLTLQDNMTLANVTSMASAFDGCSSLQSIDTSKSTLQNVTNMQYCFSGCSSLQSIDTSKWTLANVTNMQYCFEDCSSLQSIDTSKWTLQNVTNMQYCFDGCSSLQSIDTSKWTLQNVTNMHGPFAGCSKIRTLDTSKWGDLGYVTDFYNLFLKCSNLREIDTSKWTMESATNIASSFDGCSSLREIDLSSCNIMKCTHFDRWISACSLLETLRIGLIDFSLCGAVDFLCDTNIRELTGTLRGIKNNFTAKSNRMTRDSCMVVINGLETVTEAKTLTLGANNKPVSLGGKGNDPISDDDLKVATDKGWTVAFA